jgi:hypothetical protein
MSSVAIAHATGPCAAVPSQSEVEAIVGSIAMWNDEPNAVSFRPANVVTFRQLRTLAESLGVEDDGMEIFLGRDDGAEPDEREAGEVTIMRRTENPTIDRTPTSGVFLVGEVKA